MPSTTTIITATATATVGRRITTHAKTNKQTNKRAPSAFVQQRKHQNPPKSFQKFLSSSSSSSSSSSTTTAAVVSVSVNNKLPKLLYESLPWGPKKKKKDTHHPQLLLLPHQTENNKTTKQTRGQNLQPQLHTKNHPPTSQTSKTIHSQNKQTNKQKIHPQFTNKVTIFSPNLLASLKFFWQDRT
jgi:hypothetical protein